MTAAAPQRQPAWCLLHSPSHWTSARALRRPAASPPRCRRPSAPRPLATSFERTGQERHRQEFDRRFQREAERRDRRLLLRFGPLRGSPVHSIRRLAVRKPPAALHGPQCAPASFNQKLTARRLLHCPRSQRAGARLRLFRGEPCLTRRAAHPRRGAAHRRYIAKLPDLLGRRAPGARAGAHPRLPPVERIVTDVPSASSRSGINRREKRPRCCSHRDQERRRRSNVADASRARRCQWRQLHEPQRGRHQLPHDFLPQKQCAGRNADENGQSRKHQRPSRGQKPRLGTLYGL